MRLLLILGFLAFVVSFARADMPPPYDPYGVGARLEESEPFPKLVDVQPGAPAAIAGLKNGDAVIAIDGRYSKSNRVPFYFYVRGLQGPKDSVVTLVILRNEQDVFGVKLKRTVKLRSNW